MPSIRFFSRARPSSQRGYALIAAIVLAVLYFGLVQLLLMDSSRELSEARRYRAIVLAQTLAENGAELAAANMTQSSSAHVTASDWQGEIEGTMHKDAAGNFDIEARGRTSGMYEVERKVFVRGRIVQLAPGRSDLRIQYTIHTPQ